jgi:hypothetical protein
MAVIPIPGRSFAQSQLPHLRPPPLIALSYIALIPAKPSTYLHTDDINMPDSSSVGHN